MIRALVISLALHLAVLISPLLPEGLESLLSSEKRVVIGATLRQSHEVSSLPIGADRPGHRQGVSVSQNIKEARQSEKPIRAQAKLPASTSIVSAASFPPNDAHDAKPMISAEESMLSTEGEREYRLNLSREARKFKRYPLVAREHGWEGVVVVAVSIPLASGPPVASLERSSGYDELDRQALEMMQTAAKQAVLPLAMQGRRFGISVPIEYRLAK